MGTRGCRRAADDAKTPNAMVIKITRDITVIGGTVGCETGFPQPRLKSTARVDRAHRTAHHGARPRPAQGREDAGTDAT